MGNTPSAQQGAQGAGAGAGAQGTQSSPSRPTGGAAAAPPPQRGASPGASASPTSPTAGSSSRHPNLRLPMPQRPTHISPQSSNPTSPSGRGGSPRRRKSLELPDLNKLSFTPAAPVATTATTTSHHLATTSASTATSPAAKRSSPATSETGTAASLGPTAGVSRRWQQVLGGRTASPLSGANALTAMSKLDSAAVPGPKTAPVSMPGAQGVLPTRPTDTNPYFPSSPRTDGGSPRPAIPIPIPGKGDATPSDRKVEPLKTTGLTPPPPTVAATPPSRQEASDITPTAEEAAADGLVNVPVQWVGGGKVVYVTGDFAENWRHRIKMKKSTHDFNTVLRLRPGQYRLKFIVDDSWRCSKLISTATDDDGTLVNWIEVEAPKTEEELKAEWAMDAKPAAKSEDKDESQWTNSIPSPLVLYQYIEELPQNMTESEFVQWAHGIPHLSSVPQPPTLPRILDKVIVNAEPKRRWEEQPNIGGAPPPAGLDDNSILAVPNHVVLNHLTASAIKNGTLGVGTTTRYRKKYITTMFFKPTLGDLMGDVNLPHPEPASDAPPPVPAQ